MGVPFSKVILRSVLCLAGVCSVGALLGYDWLTRFHHAMLLSIATWTPPPKKKELSCLFRITKPYHSVIHIRLLVSPLLRRRLGIPFHQWQQHYDKLGNCLPVLNGSSVQSAFYCQNVSFKLLIHSWGCSYFVWVKLVPKAFVLWALYKCYHFSDSKVLHIVLQSKKPEISVVLLEGRRPQCNFVSLSQYQVESLYGNAVVLDFVL